METEVKLKEGNRIAVVKPDGTLVILVEMAGSAEPFCITSFSPEDTMRLLKLLKSQLKA